jgi:hypothetical protein
MFILEGGYHQQSLAEAVVDSFAGILGLPVLSNGNNTVLPEEPLAKVRECLLTCAFCKGICLCCIWLLACYITAVEDGATQAIQQACLDAASS